MRKLLIALLMVAAPALSWAAGPSGPLMSANININDKASLQRGAQMYVSYCAGCHSAEYVRFSRVAQDLGLTENLMQQYLIFTGAKIGDTMETAMNSSDATRWFGVVPPDLSLSARLRGVDWLYT